MSPAEREAYARGLDRERRRAEAKVAMFVHTVEQIGGHLDDNHRTPKAWGQAACNWSGAEAARFVRAGTALATFSSAAVLAEAGELGVAQLHALSSVVANPRVREHLADGEATLVGSATSLEYADYLTLLNGWVAAADPDGAHQSAERAHRNRRARVGVVGNECFLDAVGGSDPPVQEDQVVRVVQGGRRADQQRFTGGEVFLYPRVGDHRRQGVQLGDTQLAGFRQFGRCGEAGERGACFHKPGGFAA